MCMLRVHVHVHCMRTATLHVHVRDEHARCLPLSHQWAKRCRSLDCHDRAPAFTSAAALALALALAVALAVAVAF